MLHSLREICVSMTDWKGNAVIPKSVEIPGMTEYVVGHWSKRSLSRMGWWSRSLESVKENWGKSRTQTYAFGRRYCVCIYTHTDTHTHFES